MQYNLLYNIIAISNIILRSIKKDVSTIGSSLNFEKKDLSFNQKNLSHILLAKN